MKRTSARAIIIDGDRILLVHRVKNGREYYIFPGGGIEPGETLTEATVREAKEETSCDVRFERTVYHVIFDNSTDNYFSICRYIAGTPTLTKDSPEATDLENGEIFVPAWCEIRELARFTVLPIEVRDWFIKDFSSGFTEDREIHLQAP